jgi:hypothetical protein
VAVDKHSCFAHYVCIYIYMYKITFYYYYIYICIYDFIFIQPIYIIYIYMYMYMRIWVLFLLGAGEVCYRFYQSFPFCQEDLLAVGVAEIGYLSCNFWYVVDCGKDCDFDWFGKVCGRRCVVDLVRGRPCLW